MKIRLIFMLLMVCLSKAGAVTLSYLCNEDEKTATVCGLLAHEDYASYSGSIIIPDKIERSFVAGKIVEYKVVSIRSFAFKDSHLSSITLPDGIVSIGKGAFYDCSNLSSIVLPDNITRIEPSTFGYCRSLSTVVLPENLTFIGESAFSGCESLHSIAFPDKLKTIDCAAFSSSGLRSVILPEKLAILGEHDGNIGHPFTSCASLMSIDVVDGNPYFASIDGVLYTKDKHTLCIYPRGKSGEFIVPDGVIDIKGYAFRYSDISAVYFPATLREIGRLAFHGCSELTNLVLPDGIQQLDDYTFGDCGKLEKVVLPTELERIGRCVFRSCVKLESIIIPSKVTFIGGGAFDISDYGYNDKALKFVYLEAKQPPLLESEAFTAVDTDTEGEWCYPGILYVPAGCKAAYQADDGWGRFEKIEEYDPAKIDVVQEDDIICYVDGRVCIPNDNRLVQMEIYAVSGELLESCQVVADKGCDISLLPEGIYIAKIVMGKEIFSHKIKK